MSKVFVCALAVLCASFASAQYTVEYLQPSGFVGSDGASAYGGFQVGRAFDFSASPLLHHAGFWNGTAASFVDLHPASVPNGMSSAGGIWGNQAVGFVSGAFSSNQAHAALWDLTTSAWTDLHPAGLDSSQANAIFGTTQVGQATVLGLTHAAMWSGTAASFIDLAPVGSGFSGAFAVNATNQAGYLQIGSDSHAALWSGTAASFMDLHPATGFDSSQINALDGSVQGGSGFGPDTGGSSHALLWSGTAASVVDLNPTGFLSSAIKGMWNGKQVGWASTGSIGQNPHAFLWTGSATSGTLDLHQFLSSNFTGSFAYGIDPLTGDIVGQALDPETGRFEAVLWRHVVPEPFSLAGLGIGVLALFRRRRHSK